MKTEASRLFDDLNRRHWRGRLPRYRVVRLELLPGRETVTGVCRHRTRTILVKRELSGDRLRVTMLHEMAHVAARDEPGHGPRFRSQLLRLAARGESLAREEAAWYGPRVRLIRAGVVVYDGPARWDM